MPVPDDIADGKLKGKVFYVWFDAPIEYIAATKEWADANGKGDAWRDWWYGEQAKDVTYYEFMGKDNVPFHTVGFPVTIMGSRRAVEAGGPAQGLQLAQLLTAANSPPRSKRGMFMDTALEIVPADYWRYYLIANAPEGSDTQFHLGAFRRRRQQGSGRRAGQFRQPGDEILRRALRRQGAGRGRIWRGREAR